MKADNVKPPLITLQFLSKKESNDTKKQWEAWQIKLMDDYDLLKRH